MATNAYKHEKPSKRVVVESTGALFPLFADSQLVQCELQRLAMALREMNVTAVITVERVNEDTGARFNVEEFVADDVVILRNRLEHESRRRTIEILKFRGAVHQKGEFPFTIDPVNGISIAPVFSLAAITEASN